MRGEGRAAREGTPREGGVGGGLPTRERRSVKPYAYGATRDRDDPAGSVVERSPPPKQRAAEGERPTVPAVESGDEAESNGGEEEEEEVEEEEEEEEGGGGGGGEERRASNSKSSGVYPKYTKVHPKVKPPAALVAGVSGVRGGARSPPRPRRRRSNRREARAASGLLPASRRDRRGRHAHDWVSAPPSNSRASVTAEATTTRRNERRSSWRARSPTSSFAGPSSTNPPSLLPEAHSLSLRSLASPPTGRFSSPPPRAFGSWRRAVWRRAAGAARFSRFTAAVCVGTGLGAATFRRARRRRRGFGRAADGRGGGAGLGARSHRRGGRRGELRVARRGDGEARAVEANDRPRRNDDARGGRRRRRVPRGRGRGRRRRGLRRGRDVEDDSDDSERIIRGDVR